MGNSSYTTKKINYAEGLAARPNFITNSSAAENIAGWNLYADAAGSLPVDMTGGSATQLTFSRTTTGGEVLNGDASFKIVKAAANAQGQGLSTDMTIPAGYAGQQLLITLPFKITSGSLVQGDLQLFIYDITNSTIITPVNNDIIGSQGMNYAIFTLPTSCTSARFGFHFASTSTTAVTIVFDDVQISPSQTAVGGMVLSSASFSGFSGFASTNTATFTATTNDTYVGSGFTYTMSSTEGTYITIQKSGYIAVNASIQNSTPDNNTQMAIVKNPSSNQLTSGYDASPATDSVIATSMVRYNAEIVSVSGTCPVNAGDKIYLLGFTPFSSYQTDSNSGKLRVTHIASDVTLTSSSTYRMSSILANGTRVTGAAPTKLGEYRSRRKGSPLGTIVDDSPTVSPSSTDGMRIYGNENAASTGTSGHIEIYDIFIGKNKNYRVEYYSATGLTGEVCTDSVSIGTATWGAVEAYDPTTGVLTINAETIFSGSETARYLGYAPDTRVSVANGYFDVIVSENALAVGVQMPRSEVHVQGNTDYGSTNTYVLRFTNTIKNIGSAITYADSATLGGSFTINETGVYSISFSMGDTAISFTVGISLNASSGATQITSLATNQILATAGAIGGYVGLASVTANLNAGDIIRAQTNYQGNGTVNSSAVRFVITKVSN